MGSPGQSFRSTGRAHAALFVASALLGLAPLGIGAADPAFQPKIANPFGLSNPSNSCSVSLVDIDGDGDQDAFVHVKFYSLWFQRNTRSGGVAAFGATSSPFGLTAANKYTSIEFVDIDGDGDQDAFVGDFTGLTRFFRNTGNSHSPVFLLTTSTSPFGIGDIGASSYPEFVDIDGDGDFDAFIGDYAGATQFFRNTGNSTSPSFSGAPTTNPFGLANVGTNIFGANMAAPSMADMDGDGDIDALIGSSDGRFNFFRNTGNSTSPAFAASVLNPFGLSNLTYFALPRIVDIDGDGDSDVFTGGYDDIYFFHNSAAVADLKPPTSVASITATGTSGTSLSISFTASDTASGVQDTILFVKRPGDAGFSDAGLAPKGGLNGTFAYTASAGNGVYQFYTIATDLAGNVEAPPGAADDIILVDSVAPTVTISRMEPTPTTRDSVLFQMTFSEVVGPSFSVNDLILTGTLAGSATMLFSETNPGIVYRVAVMLTNPSDNGTIGVRITGTVQDPVGNLLAVPANSPLYTLANYPAGDVNKDGTVDISDVALLADANLGLVTLP